MKFCKGCGSEKLVKNGKSPEGIQKYQCKECWGTFREGGDRRLKHSLEKRLKVLKMYLEGIGIRSIERLEGVSNALIIYWIRHYAEIIKHQMRSKPIPDKLENIEILEIDELFTFYKKRKGMPMSGLLWTETGVKLLIGK